MAKSKIPNEAWNEVDVESLTPPLKKLYKTYKAASAAAGEARAVFNDAFEKRLRDMDNVVSEDQSVVIGHNFGKLSFAVTDETPRTKGKQSRGKFSIV